MTNWQQHIINLRNNKIFELSVVFIIIISALVIGAKTYEAMTAYFEILVWLDRFITVFFMVEIVIRFLAEKNKLEFFKKGWNLFDSLIIIISLIPIENSEFAFIGRLVRVFRVLRIISVLPELRVLINAFVKSLPQLGYVVLLLFIIFYIYAAMGSLVFDHIEPKLWGDISIAMLTLFRVMTFEDWTDVMYQTMEVYPLSWVYYISFIFLTAFAFLNMVIGIIVNVLETEKTKEEQLNNPQPSLTEIHNKLLQIERNLAHIQKADADNSKS